MQGTGLVLVGLGRRRFRSSWDVLYDKVVDVVVGW